MPPLVNNIQMLFPCDKFDIVSGLVPEFDENCYTPPLKRGDKVVALSAAARVSDNTLEQIRLQIESGVFKKHSIHFFLLEYGREGIEVIEQTEFSPAMKIFERDLVLEAMDLDYGCAGVDILQDALDAGQQSTPLVLSMLGELTVISTESVDEE